MRADSSNTEDDDICIFKFGEVFFSKKFNNPGKLFVFDFLIVAAFKVLLNSFVDLLFVVKLLNDEFSGNRADS